MTQATEIKRSLKDGVAFDRTTSVDQFNKVATPIDIIKQEVQAHMGIADQLSFGYTEMVHGKFNAYAGALAGITPDQTIDALKKGFPAEKFPDQARLLDVIGKSDAMKDAFHGMLSKDPTVLEGLSDMAKNPDTAKIFNAMTDTLESNPEARGIMTVVMQEIGDKEELTYANLKELTQKVGEYDPANMAQSDANLVHAFGKFGISEQDTMKMIETGKVMEMQKAQQEIFKDPGGFFDKIGEMFQGTGLGSIINGLKEFIQPLMQMIEPLLKGLGLGGESGTTPQLGNMMQKLTGGLGLN